MHCKAESERAAAIQHQLLEEPGSPKAPRTPKQGSRTPKAPKVSLLDESFLEPPTSTDALTTSRVLRSLGLTRSVQEVQAVLDGIDLDGSGRIDVDGFIKILQKFYQGEAKKRRQVFDSFDKTGSGQILISRLEEALEKMIGTAPAARSVEPAANEAGFSLLDQPKTASVSRSAFELFYKNYQKLALQQIRQNSCYSEIEVVRLREKFTQYDYNQNGTLAGKEMHRLIAENFPEATKSKEAQREVALALKEISGSVDGDIGFFDFLKLMRRFDDARDEADIKMEQEVIAELDFSMDEVEGYRQIFTANADWMGELDLETLFDILSNVVDFAAEEIDEFQKLVRQVNPEGREVVRFPHFLRLIKRITQDNYGHVNEASMRMVRKAQRSTTGATLKG